MKTQSKLKPLHPLPSDLDEIRKYGFAGELSSNPEFSTDGHAMFLSAGFDKTLIVNETSYLKKPKPGSITKIWDEAKTRDDIPANILGSMDREFSDLDLDDEDDAIAPIERAILRDDLDRIIYVNAFKLAFVLYTLKPDALSVAKDDGGLKWIRFSRGGELVGCLMPMRGSTDLTDYHAGYDVDGEPLPLAIEVDA